MWKGRGGEIGKGGEVGGIHVRIIIHRYHLFAQSITVTMSNAQIPLHTFPRNFPVDGEVANFLPTCCRDVTHVR